MGFWHISLYHQTHHIYTVAIALLEYCIIYDREVFIISLKLVVDSSVMMHCNSLYFCAKRFHVKIFLFTGMTALLEQFESFHQEILYKFYIRKLFYNKKKSELCHLIEVKETKEDCPSYLIT